jgi:acyl dehydratase
MIGRRIHVGGPYFEDFAVGQVFDDAPALTLTPGHTALHQALFGDRLRLPLDATLSAEVTGRAEAYVHPNVVCNVVIGQSTVPTQRVLGNLFYRGLILLRPVFVGDTLRTRTEIVGLKQNKRRQGDTATGLVALRIQVENQHRQPVLDFWRCPMLPLREPERETGHASRVDEIGAHLDMARVEIAIPRDWRLDVFRQRAPGAHFADLIAGTTYEIEAHDSVTSAPELARATLNIATAHTDAGASAFGRRLVYGGHTISMASAHVVRALPNLVTIVAWRSCDHLGPVFEGDVLRTEVTVEGTHPLGDGPGLVDLRVAAFALREAEEVPVLDWRPLGLMA